MIGPLQTEPYLLRKNVHKTVARGNNIIIGFHNIIIGFHNIIIGFHNIIRFHNIIIGFHNIIIRFQNIRKCVIWNLDIVYFTHRAPQERR